MQTNLYLFRTPFNSAAHLHSAAGLAATPDVWDKNRKGFHHPLQCKCENSPRCPGNKDGTLAREETVLITHTVVHQLSLMCLFLSKGLYQTPAGPSLPQRGWTSGTIFVPECAYVRLRSLCPPFRSSAAGGQSSTNDPQGLSVLLAEGCWNPVKRCDWPLEEKGGCFHCFG